MLYKTNNIAAAAVLLGAVPALAQTASSGDFNFSNSDCPGNQLLTQQDRKQYCCPGTIFGENEEQFCCVGATFEVETPSFASCFPTCTGGDGVSNIATSTQSCSTSIFFTNSDYSSLAQAAAASLSGSNSGSGSVTTTSSGSQSASTTSGTESSGASSGSMSTGSATRASATTADSENATSISDESTGGAALITSGPMLGGLMAAGGLMMAL